MVAASPFFKGLQNHHGSRERLQRQQPAN